MFLKFVKSIRFKSISLVTKLMWLYAVSTISILSAVFLFLYPTLNKFTAHLNGTQATDITAECYEKFIIALLLSSLCAIFMGKIVARKGLSRLREFENNIESISIHSLDTRIHLQDWPKELKPLGEKFNLMLDRIHRSYAQLSQFSADIAHELRNPLHNLRNATEIALINKNLSEEQRKIFECYMDEYQHLSKLIENLLFLAQTDHKKIQLNKKQINVRQEVLKICDYYHAMAIEKNITISCEGEIFIPADVILLSRLINNLLANALKYTPHNGNIQLEMKILGKHWAQIIVKDNGIGISEDHLPKIFDRFYRVDASRSSQSGGLGLGLSIVKSIVDLHQGKIDIASQLGIGTTIQIKLPLSI